MKKKLIIIGIITLLVSIELSGCNSSTKKSTPEEKVIGDWISKTYFKGRYVNGTDLQYTFYSNSSCAVNAIGNSSRNWYSYMFSGQQLITTDSSGNRYNREYSFSSDNTELVLSSSSYPDVADFLERQ